MDKPSRSLTPGEIALARSIFGDAIDYAPVRIHRRKWFPFQPSNVTMAPMGHIHFHPDSKAWSEDFAKESLHRQAHFIHEMTHVWQAQKGGRFFLPLMRHPFCRYDYRVRPGKAFRRYGLEQQASIVADIFLERNGALPKGKSAMPEIMLPFGN